MRLYEISQPNRLAAHLGGIMVDYQPLWYELRGLLEYYVQSQDSVDPSVIDLLAILQDTLTRLSKYPFDTTDPELYILRQEIHAVQQSIKDYRHLLNL